MCLLALQAVNLPIAGVDFIRSKKGEPYLIEVNSNPGFHVQKVTGINVAAAIVAYVEQDFALHQKNHLFVLAGAGTGETRTIIGRTIFLLRNNVPGKRIVLLTFTRRAAAEMTHRLELEAGDLTLAGSDHTLSWRLRALMEHDNFVNNFLNLY
ncbi:MAG: hypothetical protein D4R64_14480 [Porphyromonadaceae bacterium]|nr:MAG: hypothetical protein D4R64_14480 [Porphyromonadaceae bacterium]